jgi:hypothetical protein
MSIETETIAKTKQCDHCKEIVAYEATYCKHCHQAIGTVAAISVMAQLILYLIVAAVGFYLFWQSWPVLAKMLE